MVGTGIEKYSAEAAAAITRQAETTQYNAGYQADVTRSAGQLQAGNMRATGKRASQMAAIQAGLTSQTAATLGAATTQRMIIQAAAGFQKSQVRNYLLTRKITDPDEPSTNCNKVCVDKMAYESRMRLDGFSPISSAPLASRTHLQPVNEEVPSPSLKLYLSVAQVFPNSP